MISVSMNVKKHCLLPVLLLMFSPTLPGAAQLSQAGEVPIDQAIAAVYPSLVQIYVLTTQPQEGRERKFQASGSGAIISPEGHVITNHHVAGRALAIRCVLSTKEEMEATLVGTDPLTDISVVKLNLSSRGGKPSPLPVANFGRPGTLKVGDVVLAMGCPLAISQSVTKGIVSNTDMIFPKMMAGGLTLEGEDVGSMVKWIGHDASISPGNSGGPLVNLQGEIVGINEIGYGLSGAIPADLANAVAQELIRTGSIRRAWIGANFQPLLKSEAPGAEMQGVLVSGVIPDSPAEKGGLQAGDLVMALNGSPVSVRFQEELPGFIRQVVSLPLDQPMELKVRRAGKELPLALLPELRDEAMGREVELKEWGMTARRLTRVQARELNRPDAQGVIVGSVRQGGPANMATPPLKSMDVLVEVAGKPVSDLQSLRTLTAELTQGKTGPQLLLVALERGTEKQLSVVEVGVRLPQDPPAEAKKAWLPVATQVVSKKLATAVGLKGKKGVRITQVFPESAAEQAGFKVGDVITHVDDQQVEASEPHDGELFESMIWAYKVGSTAEFSVLREGKPLKITATLGEAPKAERELREYEDPAFEFKARDISYLDRVRNRWNKDQGGALVTQVDSGGWAAVAGLRTEDLIQSVDGKPVSAVKDLEAVLEQVRLRRPKRVVLFLKRGIYTQFIELEPTWREKS